MGEALDRAYECLTIPEVWEYFGLGPDVPAGDGMYLSPFRKEKTPSFSISMDGKRAKDFGGEGYNVAKFAKVANQYTQRFGRDGELAAALISLAGLEDFDRQNREAFQNRCRPAGFAAVASVENQKMPSVRAPTPQEIELHLAEKRERERRLKELPYKRRDDAFKLPLRGELIEPWPGFVAERFSSGSESKDMVKRVASARGWPTGWVEWLAWAEKMSYCPLPWSESRYVAFKVECPVYAGMGKWRELRPVGYHQRCYFAPRGGVEGRKSWVYVPNRPKSERTEFQKRLRRLDRTIAPLPFVLGELKAPRLVVIHEGQWDAASFYGACGLMDGWDLPIAVFGLRGVEGVRSFCEHWLGWLLKYSPAIWIFPDNDVSGSGAKLHRSWTPEGGQMEMPSFAERLERWLGYPPVVSVVDREKYGKDFNDFWKVAHPTPELMLKWMTRLKLL